MQICLLAAVLLQAASSGAQPVTKVAAGNFHSLFLKSDGSLWAMGGNGNGQLGDGTYNNTNLPEQIVPSNVTAIAAGGDHSLFLKSDGSLWAMGDNLYGELGDGTFDTTSPYGINFPEKIVSSNVTAIAAGTSYSLFLKSDSSLWGMGDNQLGQLGDGIYTNTNVPEQIVASNVTAIAAGGDHSLFLKRDGSLWAMGYNFSGQLGDGTYNTVYLPEQIVGSNVTAIAAGGYFSLFLKSDGSLWAMGGNGNGQLGDGTYNNTNLPEQIVGSNVTAIAAGGNFSLFLQSDGSLWGMGDDSCGELGDGNHNPTYYQNLSTNLPERIVASGVTAVAAASHANFWSEEPEEYDEHGLFLKNDGSLWTMGFNDYGELGDGTYTTTNRPEQILAGPPDYNRISAQLLSGGDVSLSFVGIAGTNYELDRSFSLSPANWVPEATNPAGAGGILVFTNTPDATTNNFWRIRSMP
jgi:alpha-tubulin suppressor-like RCC1 family protein